MRVAKTIHSMTKLAAIAAGGISRITGALLAATRVKPPI